MKKLAVLSFLTLGLITVSFSQSGDVKSALSKSPLTEEQVVIYRAFLQFYENGAKKQLNVADETEWLDVTELRQDSDCLKSFGQIDFESAEQGGPTVHTLVADLAVAGRIALVDPAQQRDKVRQNDPGKTMREGKSVNRAVNEAFASGLLTLSEIAFDKEHRKAVMSFSFFCGKLCGNGGIVMLKRMGQKWKLEKQTCGEWVS